MNEKQNLSYRKDCERQRGKKGGGCFQAENKRMCYKLSRNRERTKGGWWWEFNTYLFSQPSSILLVLLEGNFKIFFFF